MLTAKPTMSCPRLPLRVATLLLLAVTVGPALAQPSGSWEVHDGPDAPHTFGMTVEGDQWYGMLNGAEIPPASDAAWSSASSDLSLRWTGGQSVPCRAAADYAYFQTAVFPTAGDRTTISFLNVDDAARVTVFNEENPAGMDVEGSVVGLRERKAVDVTPALLAGATNRVVVTLANVCGPSGTMHLDVAVEPGEGEPMAAGGGDEGAALAMACKSGLLTLLANNYDYATEPDPSAVRPGAGLSFEDAYAVYADVAPACRILLEEPEAYVPADRLGALDAVVERHRARMADELDPNLSFAERTGYLDGRAGIETQGSRVPQYCPEQHQRQFSCDVATERIALSAQLLVEYMDVVAGGGATGAATTGAPAPGTRFMLTSLSHDGDECLEGNGRGGQFGGNSVMTPCAGQSGQLFEAVPAADGYVTLRTVGRGPGECLEGNAPGSGTMNGAAFMDDCRNVTGQLWRFTPTERDGVFRLQTAWRGDGECLEANGRGSQVHGGAAFMDTCQDVTGQYWRAVPAGN